MASERGLKPYTCYEMAGIWKVDSYRMAVVSNRKYLGFEAHHFMEEIRAGWSRQLLQSLIIQFGPMTLDANVQIELHNLFR